MEIVVLNQNFESIDVLDTYSSIIWTDRHDTAGDFELSAAVSDHLLSVLVSDNYLYLRDSEHLMVIETREIKSDVDNGYILLVSGRSLESLLERRIIWSQTILSGGLQAGIETLLNDNAINPTIVERKIDNLIFEASTDPAITSLQLNAQFTGDNLYDVITAICQTNGIGFKINLEEGVLIFRLYSGTDRSYTQTLNPYIVFSPSFENIISSNYFETRSMLKTITLVAGQGEGSDRETSIAEIPGGSPTGIARRELFTDARDISRVTEAGTLTDPEYFAQLIERGERYLAENQDYKNFEGEVEATHMFMYGVDFFLGDIVQIRDTFGQEARSKISEVVISENESGKNIFPTFSRI